MLVAWNGVPINEPFLRDTINVPFHSAADLQFPSVRLRMDFRDPNTIGTFLYHCHLLEHEDGGMMGLIRVEPADTAQAPEKTTASSSRSNTPARSAASN
jgi:FtsP/CotA-like multicopper oxidase with cupredoxin domain